MSVTDLLLQKADLFGVDPDRSVEERKLLTCKLMLESILESLRGDVRAITPASLDTFEEDLRIIVNEFEELEHSNNATDFIKMGLVNSVQAISTEVSRAYHSVCAASKIRELEDAAISAKQWEDYFECFRRCRGSLRKAFQQFLIH